MNSKNLETKTYKIIFHIDMNAFFASCEIANDPSLKGKPIVVAHDEPLRKSIVLTASYEARKYGIKTTMLTRDAIKLCPSVKIVEPKYYLYSKYSKMFFDYMQKITNIIEPMSIDEGFFDMSEVCKSVHPLELAKKIQNDLYKMGLPCSIGIAPNKFLAKMASDIKKPLGITVLRKREIDKYLWPLPIEDMIGIGKKTSPRLKAIGINTIGDVLKFRDQALLKKTVGDAMYEYITSRARGEGSTELAKPDPDDFSSVSNAQTFDHDIYSITIMKDMLKNLCNSVCHRLEKHGMIAKTFGVQIKYSDFQLINRSAAIKTPTNDSYDVWPFVEDLFEEHYDHRRPVRLVGVFANRLEKANMVKKEYTLFDDLDQIEKDNEVKKLLSKINTNLGKDTLVIGVKEDVKASEVKSRFEREK